MPDPTTVRKLFAAVAERYDLLNHVLSLGIDRRWRRLLVRGAGIGAGARVLDVCAGTGDIMVGFIRDGRCGRVVGVDFSIEMLSIAGEKIRARKGERPAALVCADALVLPFADAIFDVVTMGFGLRNLADYGKGVREAARVLAPGGRLFILEFAPPQRGLLLLLYRLYLRYLIPLIGGVLTKRRAAYEHLSETIAGFLAPNDVLSLMGRAGLTQLRAQPLTFGIAYRYEGRKKGGGGTIAAARSRCTP
jgi:demethylmenaquinone methyltransferase/2-methoxy-6-polyprenyl-1,4-benzoquinol methylase